MIRLISKNEFKKMPWKNGKGSTDQIYIDPPEAKLDKLNFQLRLSSAPITQDCEFSTFPGMQRILIPIRGNGFELNSQSYEKFEVAYFSGDGKVNCQLFKEAVIDFGIIYDPKLINVNGKILKLKSDFQFSMDAAEEIFITLLDGQLIFGEKPMDILETIHFKDEDVCKLNVKKNAIVFILRSKQV